jgi:urease accessory protein UreF
MSSEIARLREDEAVSAVMTGLRLSVYGYVETTAIVNDCASEMSQKMAGATALGEAALGSGG